ncbi:MAG: carboxypeptidase-like regulatory domain-containing protein [Gemmatimonadota bacterium]
MAARVTIPLDASGIEGFDPKQPIKVLLAASGRPVAAETITLDRKGQGEVTLSIEGQRRGLSVVVGPADASDDELLGLQTINIDVPVRHWRGKDDITLAPIRISPYYWFWWLRWCRTFTIHGRLLCASGQPVPGATVCAYDVDAWWWWRSQQQVGCATTDIHGAFTISFRWCCGWWPWWWWRLRTWQIEPVLASRIMKALQREPHFPKIPFPDPQPDLSLFERLVADPTAAPPGAMVRLGRAPLAAPMPSIATMASSTPLRSLRERAALDVARLDSLRERLATRLPAMPDLELIRLWPWWPWYPWWDCTPDLIFRAWQDCHGQSNLIVAETWWNARWNVPQTLNQTLVANSLACCRSGPPDCEDGECLAFTDVCDFDVSDIGGNLGAPVVPVGYGNPGLISVYGDAPFAEAVRLRGTVDCLVGVDYYEIEFRPDGGGPWLPVPPAALGAFDREYYDFGPMDQFGATFNPAVPISGHHVYETVEHHETTHTPADWGATKVWLATNFDVLAVWLTSGTFSDGTYRFRIMGYDEVGGNLQNPRLLPICGTQTTVEVVVTIDNQATYPPPGPIDNPCGGGTVHTCTNEPLTDILGAQILHTGGGATDIGACGNVALHAGDILQVDFIAHDPNDHLAWYSLIATYGENLANDLLGLAGATLLPLGGQVVPPAIQVGPSYVEARLAGAVPPVWAGGALRLQVPAALAFPETCCYQLELRAYKRTVVGCSQNFAHRNLSERSFQVTV